MRIELRFQKIQFIADPFLFHVVHILPKPDLLDRLLNRHRNDHPNKNIQKGLTEDRHRVRSRCAGPEEMHLQPDGQRCAQQSTHCDGRRQKKREQQIFFPVQEPRYGISHLRIKIRRNEQKIAELDGQRPGDSEDMIMENGDPAQIEAGPEPDRYPDTLLFHWS